MQRLPPRLRTWLRAAFWFAVELAVEVSLTVVFLKAYNGTRNLFGSSQEGSLQVALRNALDIVAVERALGVYWEEAVQEASLTLGPTWIRAWNIFYCSAHMAVTIFVLLFLFTVQPAAYQRCRWTFMLMNIIAMAGYAGYPLMPPRLLPVCDGAYGGCLQGFSYVDTMHEYGGLWSWRQKSVAKLSNQYAAMPSMHAGYSLWCSMSMYEHSPFKALRMAGALYPLFTMYCIVVTANHYLLDAVVGAVVFYVAHCAAPYMPHFGRGASPDGVGVHAQLPKSGSGGLVVSVNASAGDGAAGQPPKAAPAPLRSVHVHLVQPLDPPRDKRH